MSKKKEARCKVSGCKGTVFARGKCQKDYRREVRKETGDGDKQIQFANRYDEPRATLTTRVKKTTKEALEADGTSAYLMSSKILDEWAEGKRRRRVA